MKENFFDEALRDRLQHQPSDVPAGMWQRISDARKKKRDRTIFFWFFFAFLLTGSALYLVVPQPEHGQLKKLRTGLEQMHSVDSRIPGNNLKKQPRIGFCKAAKQAY